LNIYKFTKTCFFHLSRLVLLFGGIVSISSFAFAGSNFDLLAKSAKINFLFEPNIVSSNGRKDMLSKSKFDEIIYGFSISNQRFIQNRTQFMKERIPKPVNRTTYLNDLFGKNSDFDFGKDVDANGNIYLVGMTSSSDFPVTANAAQKNLSGVTDAFVMKINPKLKGKDSIIYATYLGGSQSDFGLGIKVDKNGAAYITGRTNSNDFPVTPNAFQQYSRGGGETFIAKLSPDGSKLEFSTFFGGSGSDYAYSIDLDENGNSCIAGTTDSQDLTTSFNAVQPQSAGKSDALVACFNPTGEKLLYSTYFGGNGFDDAFEIKLKSKNQIQIIGTTEGLSQRQFPESIEQDDNGNFKADINLEGNNFIQAKLSDKRR
jgi:Beta-propeller repeat